MARKLKTYVSVAERDEHGNPTGRTATFGPDADLPEWAEKAIINPDVWAADDTSPAASAEPDGQSQPSSRRPPRRTQRRSQ